MNRSSRPRLIIADDNIRDIGGHFFELAQLLLKGAAELGYEGVLATNACFSDAAAVPAGTKLVPTFHTRRLVHWSMGVDGHSRFRRDFDGKTVGGTAAENLWSNLRDRVSPKRRPQTMLRQWADDLVTMLKKTNPSRDDCLLINTGDDFALLALAAALKQADLPLQRIDVLLHFALYEGGQDDRAARLRQIGRQMKDSLRLLGSFDVHLHATTQNLANQYRETECGHRIDAVPYPTRPRNIVSGRSDAPWKAVLAGLPRAEKGRGAIAELLSAIEDSMLRSRRFRLSMQMPSQRWEKMIPSSMHSLYRRAAEGSTTEPIEVMRDNLSTADYHDWLDGADIGLFLYEPERYVARCSGVLLEMFARGIPVIVPDGCWLADAVRAAGGHRSIGFIYQDRAEIPDLLDQFARHRVAIRQRAAEHAAKIAFRHSGKNTLVTMGLPAVDNHRRVA